MPITLPDLPVTEALPRLRETLASHANVVLQAPPGAGKSTLVPLALLEAPWLASNRIVMLEPRRLAARAVATRMAQLLDEPVGRTVGYRTRLDSRVSGQTRIEVVTEGILTRWLQRDAALEGIGLLIFDEFHERSLQADLGLALALDAQGTLRDDLKMLVMSATLDGEGVAKLLGDAPIVSSAGRMFPVETHHRERPPGQAARGRDEDIAVVTASIVRRSIEQDEGDVLVFLPGQGEIRRTQRFLEESLPPRTRVLPLYGELPIEEQDAAIRPSAAGDRKIVLATNIAETSLTIEGVRVVVDAGLARRSRFDPATGMSRLEVVRISRASADQRRGRAGRLAPGICYRLWPEPEQGMLAAQTPAEILEADLAPLALELANWGISDPQQLRWLDVPPAASFAQARDLLKDLDAVDADGRINSHGRTLARIGVHPRLAHMIVRGGEMGLRQPALQIAALLGERDLLRSSGQRDIDLRLRIDALRERRTSRSATIDAGVRQRVTRSIDLLARQVSAPQSREAEYDDASAGRLLALAYPDRIAQSRGEGGRYLLTSGRGAKLADVSSIGRAEFLVIADLDAGEREATIRLAAPIERATLEADFASHIDTRERIEWNSREQAVNAQRERWLGAVCLESRRLDTPDSGKMVSALVAGIRELGLASLPWTKESRALQSRIDFVHLHDKRSTKPWPATSDAALLETLEHWLAPWLDGMTRRDHWSRLDLHGALIGLLDWDQQQRLNELTPTHLAVPSGSRIPIDYSTPSPTVAVRLQEVFGMHETPRVAGVPLTLELLSPAHRPVQVTQDLASFWSRGYAEVKRELKGRYPRHYWPDDPLTAEATSRAKPRGT
ncbi:ATP-dependent helicase HrpB [Povalibacter uvarum]|uniref:ATP-dependent helicase HrpB n=1 Tax=Povalibacter uvarum TaxID=732238 RepID=A0A841HQ95_9GAMM|nr:ATP-dependent helicase HrpB [Povalibacter uvarum]MBB6094499.1 ATP-dependent helicase HrpB [Povalibacter uvarum]